MNASKENPPCHAQSSLQGTPLHFYTIFFLIKLSSFKPILLLVNSSYQVSCQPLPYAGALTPLPAVLTFLVIGNQSFLRRVLVPFKSLGFRSHDLGVRYAPQHCKVTASRACQWTEIYMHSQMFTSIFISISIYFKTMNSYKYLQLQSNIVSFSLIFSIFIFVTSCFESNVLRCHYHLYISLFDQFPGEFSFSIATNFHKCHYGYDPPIPGHHSFGVSPQSSRGVTPVLDHSLACSD